MLWVVCIDWSLTKLEIREPRLIADVIEHCFDTWCNSDMCLVWMQTLSQQFHLLLTEPQNLSLGDITDRCHVYSFRRNYCSCSQMITQLVRRYTFSLSCFSIQLSVNCSKGRMLRQVLMPSPFKCQITHIKVPKLAIVHSDRFSVISVNGWSSVMRFNVELFYENAEPQKS